MFLSILLNLALIQTPPAQGNDAPAVAPLTPGSPIRPASPVRRATGTAAAGVLNPRLEIVEAGTEDTGGLATTLRVDPLDQRLPTGFQRVYRVPGSDSLMMRGNGALFAVFPVSSYMSTRGGTVPALPAGTVFHIGMPTEADGDLQFGNGAPPSMPQRATVDTGGATVPTRTRVRVDGRIEPQRRGPTPAGAWMPTPTASPDTMNARAQSGEQRGDAERDARSVTSEDASAETASESSAATDPYASLKLGPARITRGE